MSGQILVDIAITFMLAAFWLAVIFSPIAILVLLPVYWLIRKGRFSLAGLMVVIGCIALFFALLSAIARLPFESLAW